MTAVVRAWRQLVDQQLPIDDEHFHSKHADVLESAGDRVGEIRCSARDVRSDGAVQDSVDVGVVGYGVHRGVATAVRASTTETSPSSCSRCSNTHG